MKRVIRYIRQHLYLRLGLEILLILGSVFGLTLAILFYYSRQQAQEAAVKKANDTLNETVCKIDSIMDYTEKVTADMELLVQQHLQPDSLLTYSRRVLEQHPDILGFTIALKPDFFPEYGRYFSAYSLRQGDSITSVMENSDYLNQIWYKKAWDEKRPVWLEPYIDATPGSLTSNEYNYSYTKLLYNKDHQPIGVLCTDLLLKWLSETCTEVKPYPHSSAIMLSHDGHYIVHPDTAKLVRETIFSDPDPKARQEVIPLGQSMLAGQSGVWELIVDGQPAHVFYRPLKRTGWSIAIVCPDSDVFSSYHELLYTIWTIIGISLLILLLFCYLIIRRAIIPINQLANSSRQIVAGNFGEHQSLEMIIEPSSRPDIIGQLQNNFHKMQQALQSHVSQLRHITIETEQKNQELQEANKMVREAAQRKAVFMQSMAHQIRTPLNIINGFAQVIAVNFKEFPEAELHDITTRMKESAVTIRRIATMMAAAAASDAGQKPDFKLTTFSCNAICREVIAATRQNVHSNIEMFFQTSVPDTQMIHTDHRSLQLILEELLNNANRFTDKGSITLDVSQQGDTIQFAVSDTGPVIPPSLHDDIFKRFTKIDDFTEGIGLGLPLSQCTARLLGGDVTLDAAYVDGARFIVTLPVTIQEPTSNK